MSDMEYICGWRVNDDICIDDEWHGGAHILVSLAELEATV